MSKDNITTKKPKKQYKHLTIKERSQIEILINIKDSNGKRIYNNSYIAKKIGVHKSTISKEIRKRIKSKISIMTGNIRNKPYNSTDAHNDYLFKRRLSKAKYKLDDHPKMTKYIEKKIKEDKWAPDAIVGHMKRNGYFKKDGFCEITTPTVYNAIRNNVINVKIEDTRRMKYDPKYEYKNKKALPISKKEYSIEHRPDEVDKRLVFGHFELDTILSKRNGVNECLMTLTERKTRFQMIFKLSAKTSENVVNKFNEIKNFMKSNYNKIFKSITTDNGTEFSNFLEIIKDSKTKIYFCHPYCSGEKGTNEKHNSIIRYFIPKRKAIENYSFQKINNITDWMNNYPRKILDYRTPLEALLEEFNNTAVINKIYRLQEKVNKALMF